jgi:hypothetical protein
MKGDEMSGEENNEDRHERQECSKYLELQESSRERHTTSHVPHSHTTRTSEQLPHWPCAQNSLGGES